MTVADRLDRLRAVADGCSLAAFGDLRTRLMLRVSSDHPWPQERLDELCTQAVRCFDRADSSAISSHLLGGARGVAGGTSTCARITPITAIIQTLSRGGPHTARSKRAPGTSCVRK